MAVVVKNLELPDSTILADGYLRVQSINIAHTDKEHLVPISETELMATWTTQVEAKANIFIWADKVARSNRAQVQHWFTFEFDYDLSVHANIFEQAYAKLKEIYPEGVDD